MGDRLWHHGSLMLPDPSTKDVAARAAFLASARPHLLQVTNHGIHDWQVVPGLPDTGGQNVYVNLLTDALVALGFKVTIANRGGYAHPVHGAARVGEVYADEARRIIYLDDGLARFVAKEEMDGQIPALAVDLARQLVSDEDEPAAIISHYWDGARVASLARGALAQGCPHVWIPHSLGTIKRRNMPEASWPALRLDERVRRERELLSEGGGVDAVAATSLVLCEALAADYGCHDPLFLPPCVDAQRYQPREVAPDDPLWHLLAEASGQSPAALRSRRIISEISRTDRTKRKDVLLRAFARVRQVAADALLVVSIDDAGAPELAGELRALISELGLLGQVAVLGSVWQHLPSLYAASAVYCTPSVMEGFGMSIQEAAACGVPAVSSDLVPFAVEVLAAPPLGQPAGALIAAADDVESFATGLRTLLTDEPLRRRMGAAARAITVPAFTWDHRTRTFLAAAGIPLPGV